MKGLNGMLVLGVASSLTLTGCFLSPMQGSWELDVEDADDCTMELEIEQKGEELAGTASLDCKLFFNDGTTYTLEADDEDLEGEFDDGEFELTFEFHDSYFDEDIEIILEGELDGDEMEGDIELDGEDWGEFTGERAD